MPFNRIVCDGCGEVECCMLWCLSTLGATHYCYLCKSCECKLLKVIGQ